MSDDERRGDQGDESEESEEESEEQRERYRELLEETRTVMPGTQVLFAFLLTAAFSTGFKDLDLLGRRSSGPCSWRRSRPSSSWDPRRSTVSPRPTVGPSA